MKTAFKYTFLAIFAFFVVLNVFIFVASIKMGAQINVWEHKLGKVQKQNIELENKIVELNSFQYASSIAAQLDFSQRAKPVYLDNVSYALNR